MRSFNRGEKVALADLTPANDLMVGLDAVGSGSETFDISCFGVNADDQLFDDRYFIFYNQRSSPEGALTASGAPTETPSVPGAPRPATAEHS